MTASTGGIPRLCAGDRLSRAEFERRYAAMPDCKKAELIEGVVYMPSPVSLRHGEPHFQMSGWLAYYAAATSHVQGTDNSTLRLDLDNEAQPDLLLRILPECGGGCRLGADGYLEGPPELVVEVAASSASHDLHTKLHAYRRNGVQEYVVWRVDDGAIDWFALRGGNYERLVADGKGVLRSEVFPGLWLDVTALLARDMQVVLQRLDAGIRSAGHTAFQARLQQARGPAANA